MCPKKGNELKRLAPHLFVSCCLEGAGRLTTNACTSPEPAPHAEPVTIPNFRILSDRNVYRAFARFGAPRGIFGINVKADL